MELVQLHIKIPQIMLEMCAGLLKSTPPTFYTISTDGNIPRCDFLAMECISSRQCVLNWSTKQHQVAFIQQKEPDYVHIACRCSEKHLHAGSEPTIGHIVKKIVSHQSICILELCPLKLSSVIIFWLYLLKLSLWSDSGIRCRSAVCGSTQWP